MQNAALLAEVRRQQAELLPVRGGAAARAPAAEEAALPLFDVKQNYLKQKKSVVVALAADGVRFLESRTAARPTKPAPLIWTHHHPQARS